MFLQLSPLSVFLPLFSISDLRTRRIPNLLLLIALLPGLMVPDLRFFFLSLLAASLPALCLLLSDRRCEQLPLAPFFFAGYALLNLGVESGLVHRIFLH